MDTRDIVFDTTLIRATGNFEVSVVTPLFVPAVLDQPVVFAILGTVTDHFDGVATEHLPCLMGVDTALVGQEVRVDAESDGQRTVVHQLLHHLLHGGDRICVGALGLVGRIVCGVLAFTALLRALRGGVLVARAFGVLARGGHVVGAWGQGVRATRGAFADVWVVPAGHDADITHPLERGTGLATVAAHAEPAGEALAARGGVFRGEFLVFARSNAPAIFEGFRRAKGPARSTAGLVAHLRDDGAVGVRGDGVVLLGQFLDWVLDVAPVRKFGVGVLGVSFQPSPTQSLAFFDGPEAGWHGGSPARRRVAVHLGGDFVEGHFLPVHGGDHGHGCEDKFLHADDDEKKMVTMKAFQRETCSRLREYTSVFNAPDGGEDPLVPAPRPH